MAKVNRRLSPDSKAAQPAANCSVDFGAEECYNKRRQESIAFLNPLFAARTRLQAALRKKVPIIVINRRREAFSGRSGGIG
jgi:hypothetical protein